MRITTKKTLRVERPRRVVLLPLLLCVLLATLLTLFGTHAPALSERTLLASADANRVPAPRTGDAAAPPPSEESEAAGEPRKCPHVVLFSSARHGSTWFIDSVERCRYSRSPDKAAGEPFASAVFRHTEPWKHNRSALFDMPGHRVAAYVVDNSSVKVFSSTLEINRPGVEALAKEGARLRVPFVVLRREPEATFRSLRVAKETGVWNGVGSKDVGDVKEMEGFEKYKDGIERYYARVDGILKEAGVTVVDVVDYDAIKDLRYIRLENSGCYIRNCNFSD